MIIDSRRGIASLLVVLLAGCGGAGDDDRSAAAEPAADENERADTVFDPMLQTMDRAEQAGETVEQRKGELDRALEEQEN